MKTPRSPWRLLLASLAGLFAALLSAELILRAASDGTYRVWTPGLVTVFHPSPGLMPGIEGPSRFAINSVGLRGPEPPDEEPEAQAPTWIVLALGGSTTECLYLDQSESWPALVGEHLAARRNAPVFVGNAGKSGRTLADNELQLEKLLHQAPRPDAVLLLPGVNDLCLRLALDAQYESAPALPRRERLARAFDVVPLADGPGGWWRRTALFRLARDLKAGLDPAERVQDDAGEVYDTWRRRRREAAHWREEMPGLESALDAFRQGLARMHGALQAQTHAPELILLTQPSLWDESVAPEVEALFWLGGVGDYQNTDQGTYYTSRALGAGLERFNEVTRSYAAQHDLVCIELARGVRAPELFYDEVHFNEAGARRVAELVAEALDR